MKSYTNDEVQATHVTLLSLTAVGMNADLGGEQPEQPNGMPVNHVNEETVNEENGERTTTNTSQPEPPVRVNTEGDVRRKTKMYEEKSETFTASTTTTSYMTSTGPPVPGGSTGNAPVDGDLNRKMVWTGEGEQVDEEDLSPEERLELLRLLREQPSDGEEVLVQGNCHSNMEEFFNILHPEDPEVEDPEVMINQAQILCGYSTAPPAPSVVQAFLTEVQQWSNYYTQDENGETQKTDADSYEIQIADTIVVTGISADQKDADVIEHFKSGFEVGNIGSIYKTKAGEHIISFEDTPGFSGQDAVKQVKKKYDGVKDALKIKIQMYQTRLNEMQAGVDKAKKAADDAAQKAADDAAKKAAAKEAALSPTGPKPRPIGVKSATRNITPSVSTSVRPLKITDTRDVVTRPGSSPNKSGANNSGANKSGTTPSGNSVTTPASDAVAANRKAVAANMTGKFAQMAATPAPTRPGSAANKSASTAIATGTAPTAMPTAISTQRFAIAQQKEKHPVQGGSIPVTITQKTGKKSLAPVPEGATDETAAKALLATMMLSAAAVAAGGATAPPSTGPVPVASPENPEKAPENPEKKNTISKEALNEALNAISREAPETSEKTPVCSSPLKTFDENVHNQILATEIQNVEARTRGEEAWKAHMDTLSEIRAQQLMAQDVDVFNQNTGSKVTQEEYVSHYVSELEAFQAVPILNALTSPKPDVEVPKAGEDNKAGEDKDKKDKNQIEQVPKTGEEPKTGDNVSDATVLKTMPSTAGTSTASTTQLPITATREVLSKAGTSTASTSRLQIAPTRAVFDRPTTAANKSDSTNTSANTSTNTSANTSVSKTPASGAKTPSTSDASSRASVEAIAKNRETIAKGCTGKFLAMANVKHIPRPTK
eukprot:352125_1